MMLALIMMAGLAIDAGQLFVARRTMQEAADAAAYAGAVVLYQGGTSAEAVAAAVSDAQRNGYVNGVGGNTVTFNLPPASGPFAANASYLEVLIESQVKTSLVPGGQLTTVKVRGVGGAVPLNNGFAIMALDRGNTGAALRVQSLGVVNVTGAGIKVNSTSSNAAEAQPGATISVSPGQPAPAVAGGVSGTWPNPQTAQPQAADPFAGYPKPSTAGMTVYTSLPPGPNPTLSPGIYTVPIEGAGGTTITFGSGIYITKAGLNAVGNADLVSSAGGVFIFNTNQNYPNPGGGGCGPVRLSGSATSNLQPMTTGTYRGLLVYQDQSCTTTMTISGSGSLTTGGTIYLPNAGFVMNGTSATLSGGQLVAKTVDVQNGNLTIGFTAGGTAQPVLPRLSE